MNTQATWGDALKIWWAWIWRSVLVSMGLGFVVGLGAGFIGSMLGVPEATGTLLSAALGAIIGLVVGIFILKHVLNKEYSNFRITVVRK